MINSYVALLMYGTVDHVNFSDLTMNEVRNTLSTAPGIRLFPVYRQHQEETLIIIDGGIGTTGGRTELTGEDKWLDPDAIAREYLHIHRQHRSAWTWEVELRPWVESF